MTTVNCNSLLRQALAALTVSFVAISLGAAFGVMSGRGALPGILSAGVIALIAAAFGGTRVQCSGPTAPMTALMIALVSAVGGGLLDGVPDADPVRFINMVMLLTGALLILAGALRLGRFIRLVPAVVISGFMNGIAVLIWLGESKALLGLGGKAPYSGGVPLNLLVALVTLALVFWLSSALRRLDRRLAALLPSTLVAIIFMTALCSLLELDIQRVTLGASLSSFGDLQRMILANVPTQWSAELVYLALPFALQLALLAYLDSLLTSLVVDQKYSALHGVEEITRPNVELRAQGVANGVVAFFGGIPGAQATIRSVLILNEGATRRIAGVLVGAFVLVEMLLCQDLVGLIPQAVFAGVLLKVGYDVFDWKTVAALLLRPQRGTLRPGAILFIAGTTAVTVFVDLSVAVISFTVLFYIIRRWAVVELAEEAPDDR